MFTVLMLSGVLAFAQTRVVTGKVVDDAGKAVPFASVLVQGSNTGTRTDVNGEYSIRVKTGDVLQISSTDFEAAAVAINASTTTLTTELTLKANTIKEVIVTSAFQTKRTLRSQSSSVQNVSSEQLNTVRQANVNNALAGKVAGAQVQSQSAVALGRETKIRLRGENGIGVGSGPIYVVDGTIVPSSGDINPDDIDNITVLQGPASAALFGPDGANGAIVIQTKKGRKNAPGIGIEINSAITFDKIYITPNYQNSYSGGSGPTMLQYHWQPGQPIEWQALDGKYYHNYDDDASWGPRMAGQEYIPWYAWYGGHERSFQTAKLVPQASNVRDFYNTGVTKTNNFAFSKATDNLNVRVSYTNLDIKGLIPNSYLKRHTFNAGISLDLSSHWNLSSNINYINQRRNSESNDAYSNASSGSFNQWFHRDLDINILRDLRGLQTPQGVYASWNLSNPDSYDPDDPSSFYKANYWFNPYTYFDLVKNFDERNRLFGDATLTYKFNNDLKLSGTYRRQQLTTNGYDIYPSEMEASSVQSGFNPYGETTAESNLAAYATSQSTSTRQFYEGLLSYSKKIRDFQVNANTGFVFRKDEIRTFAANTSGGLVIPGVYSLTNSVNPIRNYLNTPAVTRFEDITNYKNRAVFIRADIGYKNWAFIEGTFRRDYASAEPVDFHIDTKSVGASLVFSDLIKNKGVLNFGKIRASWGQILNSLSPYALDVYYAQGPSFDGNATMTVPDELPSPTLHGAANEEKEIGIELRGFKNRVGANVTYWNRTNKDFPVSVSTSTPSGIRYITTNAGEVAKKGIDVSVFVNPVKMKNFNWDINATWAYLLRNEVIAIAPGLPRLVTANGDYGPTSSNPLSAWTVSEIGKEWGQLHGTGIKRNDAGQPVLDADGLFLPESDVNYGSVLPRYTGGVQNTFTFFKNFFANVNIDYSVGGKFFSLSNYWGDFSGLTARTAELNDRGVPVRNAVEDGGGVHVTGVDEDGKPVDTYVDAYTYYHQFYTSKISEKHVYDLTYVKLREVSFGYRFPIERMGKVGKYFTGATVSVIGRNFWLIYSKTKDFDPSEISGVQGENGQFPGSRSIGVNLKLNF
jgi:TonB-linked SusC/RagA family outer membrane protein